MFVCFGATWTFDANIASLVICPSPVRGNVGSSLSLGIWTAVGGVAPHMRGPSFFFGWAWSGPSGECESKLGSVQLWGVSENLELR